MPQREYRGCKRCGQQIPEHKRSDAVYCSKQCQDHGSRTLRRAVSRAALRCMYCDGPLDAGHSGAKYCSELCKSRYRESRPDADTKRRFRKGSLQRRYGITLAEYESLLEEQNGVCAICHQTNTAIDKRTGQPRALAVDHCHTTGKVRGLLCSDCNVGLGLLREDADLIRKAIAYISSRDQT